VPGCRPSVNVVTVVAGSARVMEDARLGTSVDIGPECSSCDVLRAEEAMLTVRTSNPTYLVFSWWAERRRGLWKEHWQLRLHATEL
jgi:hypothetical protein